MRRGPFRLLLLLVLTAAAGCASSGAAGGGGLPYSDLDCTDPSLVAAGYGYAYGAYYDTADNPCVAYPSRYYVSPTPESAARNVVLVEAPRPHTTTVGRPDFSGLTSMNSDYGTVSRDPYSPISPAAPVVPVTSTPTTTTIAPRGSN